MTKQKVLYYMLEKFKERLKAKTTAAGVNLSKERITAYADRLHKKFPDLTDEKEHDEMIDEFDELVSFSDVAKQDDRVRTLEKTKGQKTPEEMAAEKTASDKAAEDKTAADAASKDEPAWFKTYRETTDAKIQAFEKKETEASIKGKIKGHEKAKDIPETYYRKWKLPENEDGVEDFVTELATDYDAFNQAQVEKGLAQQQRPAGGNGERSKRQASKEEVADVLKRL